MCGAQPGAACGCSAECQHLFHLLIPGKKLEEGKATGNTLQNSLVYIRTYHFSPDHQFTSDIQTQKRVITESFFSPPLFTVSLEIVSFANFTRL